MYYEIWLLLELDLPSMVCSRQAKKEVSIIPTLYRTFWKSYFAFSMYEFCSMLLIVISPMVLRYENHDVVVPDVSWVAWWRFFFNILRLLCPTIACAVYYWTSLIVTSQHGKGLCTQVSCSLYRLWRPYSWLKVSIYRPVRWCALSRV